MSVLRSLSACALLALVAGGVASAQYGTGWTIPAGAENEQSPLEPSAGVLKKGKAVFDARCSKCHGPLGKGDGPDSNPRSPAANLTDPLGADLNPRGVMFYRVWNGRPPVMPAFKSGLTRDEVWTVVEYAASLRKSPQD